MAVIKRNSTQKKSKFFDFNARSLIQIKPILVLLCVGILYFTYANWQSWLEKLDDKPISAFALLGTPSYTTNADVRDMILKMGKLKGFFGQDVDVIREQIQSMPWVKGAVVRKIWPNRLSILVAEYQPIAYWNADQFLSSDGVVFKLPTDKLKETNMPRLFGPDYKSAEVLEAWYKIFNELKAKNLVLKSVSIDERGAWEITLDNDILLKLGRGEWKTKIDRFVTIYPQIEIPENKRIAYVDLRYKAGGSVGFVDK
ncbi:MAG: cell division protein FtsQ/DivIB [[Actinobacillus] rossii]|uniref:Cell division protein FtsQ n=1 Tax=[Actinobacillus] rossii TaxID=123820 RepID=A0A380TQR4_9PAST|nr:cell division protein FtsQ/DivIB [[Actinobacillus] rossii]MDD7425460.1 cell division protein FtsQ/DivIB [[Actinobacillus] rossii]MDY3123490.1 cell division protein FtsQ/DivIB [[Actinobacillus] rossii]MDY4506831.1 cell division protein FtsQ/DivIB [[Actinobacillus] rossii]SUT89533.1 cell division protein FtsQ [[Actinobacillus] rossii]